MKYIFLRHNEKRGFLVQMKKAGWEDFYKKNVHNVKDHLEADSKIVKKIDDDAADLIKAAKKGTVGRFRNVLQQIHPFIRSSVVNVLDKEDPKGTEFDFFETPVARYATPLLRVTCDRRGAHYNSEKAILLLQNGANPNPIGNEEMVSQMNLVGTPLHYAVFKDDVVVAQLLLEKGANPNAMAINFEGAHEDEFMYYGSPLRWAVKKNYLAIAQLLLQGIGPSGERADPHQFGSCNDAYKTTILDLARKLEFPAMVQLLENA